MNPEIQTPRGAEKFAEKFEKIRQSYFTAGVNKIDAIKRSAVKLLKSSQQLCEYFLLNCAETQFRFAMFGLDEVAKHYANREFLETLKQVQRRFSQYDLTSAMDVVAYAIAQDAYLSITKKEKIIDRAKNVALLKAQAEQGDPVAQYLFSLRLYFGSGGISDYDEARKWAEMAIENGYAPAELFRDLPRN